MSTNRTRAHVLDNNIVRSLARLGNRKKAARSQRRPFPIGALSVAARTLSLRRFLSVLFSFSLSGTDDFFKSHLFRLFLSRSGCAFWSFSFFNLFFCFFPAR
ncbi:hypothetical protein [Pandoravirus japonicus]|uniref:Transmembrane protein n=1 Tax=Pandoravirus japonicus TaxID=2823154 RepID=A0A811BMI4_9VIRU|nr:hypothetical protein [Pandoravirus japonicus]